MREDPKNGRAIAHESCSFFDVQAAKTDMGSVEPNFPDRSSPQREELKGPLDANRGSKILAAGSVLWLAAIVGTFALIANFTNTPGQSGTVPSRWPAQSSIPLDATHPTLIMFAHPHCPCTRASLGELDLLMARCQKHVKAHVVFIKLEGTSTDWMNTDLWRQASAIPGVSVHCDVAGVESRLFGSETSGQTVLYDSTGSLLFQGGITISRGHAGDNPGRSALVALLENKSSSQTETPVFGCPLFNRECREGGAACKQ